MDVIGSCMAEIMPAPSEWDRRRDYRYDELGRVEEETVAGRLRIDYQYDENSKRLTKKTSTDITLNQSRQQRWVYNNDGLLIAEQDADGFVTHHHYNGANQLIKSEQFVKNISLTADITTITDRRPDDDRTTRYYYNSTGEQVGVLNYQGVLSESQYNEATRTRVDTAYQSFIKASDIDFDSADLASLRALATSDADEITTSRFDKAGRLVESLNAQGLRSEYFYNGQGQLTRTRMTDTNTQEQRANQQFFDALGRVSAELNGRGSKLYSDSLDEAAVAALIAQYGTRYQYDNNNRITQITDAKGQVTRFWFDDENRRQLTINHDGQMSLTHANAFGETISTRDFITRLPASVNLSVDTPALFTAIEGLIDEARDRVNQNRYDRFGKLRRHTDGEGFNHTYNFSGFGQLYEQRQSLIKQGQDGRDKQDRLQRFFYDGRGFCISRLKCSVIPDKLDTYE